LPSLANPMMFCCVSGKTKEEYFLLSALLTNATLADNQKKTHETVKCYKYGGGNETKYGWGLGDIPLISTVGPRPKIWTRDQNGRSNAKDGTPGRRDNLEGGELDPAVDVRRRCKKNSPSVL